MTSLAAVVTGSSSGIGAATVGILLDAGYRVVGLDLDTSPHNHPRYHSVTCDVSSEASVRAGVAEAVSRHGAPHLLVNSAGLYRAEDVLGEGIADFDLMWSVNVRGTLLASTSIADIMQSNGGGAIVNVSSVAAFESTAENLGYSATKGAVSSLTRGLAVTLAPHGIRVNAVAPGPIATPMGQAATSDPAYQTRMLDRVLLNRFGTPHEVAAAILFLGGPSAAFITGQVLPVDGGVLAHR
ncbi:SDR family oxidoreductase [Rathayibacter sp. VKM Ac-2804]|uniref:SDR family NAD(P)-dependent oxidoreductase n=1 Tax=Rathayibacter sp. VKM Ac-2804 TaxID=2609257 RepID=UPI00132E8595|nr:SDR family oxidoreductase [Rathayibacter sp. VKM Ac-2804]QHF24554.1 SDR family oxidoreductase [Rathayibacter sp. VKM Ac-2804]